jgi:hypothetical protein
MESISDNTNEFLAEKNQILPDRLQDFSGFSHRAFTG